MRVFPFMNVAGTSKGSGLARAVGVEGFSLLAQPFHWLAVPRRSTLLSATAARLLRHVREPSVPPMSEEWLRHCDRESGRQVDY